MTPSRRLSVQFLLLGGNLTNLEFDSASGQLVQHFLFLGKQEDRLSDLAGPFAVLDAAKVEALDLRTRVADALGIGNAAGDDEQLVLIGDTAVERLDAVINCFDNKFHALGFCQAQRRHLEAVRGGIVVGDQNAVRADRLRPREGDLTMQQAMVDTYELDHFPAPFVCLKLFRFVLRRTVRQIGAKNDVLLGALHDAGKLCRQALSRACSDLD